MIRALEFSNQTEELTWVLEQVDQLIKNGESPDSIGIIGREHNHLETLSHGFNNLKIPISYERKNNALKQDHVQWLILIMRFVHSLNQVNQTSQEELLPKILALPFFEIAPITIYDLAVQASTNKTKWLNTMIEYNCLAFSDPEINKLESQKVRKVANYLLELGKQSKVLAIDELLDQIMGAEKANKIDDKLIDATDEFESDEIE